MAIYELENRVYFDGAIAVDAIDISEAMEPSSDVVDADAENSIDSDSIEEYSADDFTNEPLLEVDYNNIDTLIVNLGEIDLSNFEFDLQETVENTESSDAVSSKILLVSNELSDAITANDTTTVIEYSSETSLESLLEQIRNEVFELTDTDSDISADISIELATTDGNIDIIEISNDDSELQSILPGTEFEQQEFLSELNEISNTETSLTSEIVFINSSVIDAEEIINDLPENVDIVYLTTGEDGIQGITDYLADKTDIDTVRIISHGNEGYFVLNGEVIDGDFVTENADRIAEWGDSLSEDGDIVLYGCNLAATTEGQDLVQHIADLTGADVAASTDSTGGNSMNNDLSVSVPFLPQITDLGQPATGSGWNLEYSTGAIEAAPLTIIGYEHHLTDYLVLNTDSGSDIEHSFGWAVEQANINPGANSITFDSSINGQTIFLEQTLNIANDLTITGNGVDNTFIVAYDGNAALNIDDGDDTSQIAVTLENLTFENGFDGAKPSIVNGENLTVNSSEIDGIDYVYAHIPNAVENPKVLLVSSILEDVDDLAKAAKDNVIVLEYNPNTTDLNELSSMAKNALNGREASSIAFAAHDYGENKFYLTGSETVSIGSTLGDSEQQEFWQNVAGMIQEDGRIDLLACNLAAGDNGGLLIASLESVAGINFAASTDATGNPEAGGNWILETDNINAEEYFNSVELKYYSALMWAEAKELTASDAQDYDYFGYSVSISGDTALIGAYGEDSEAGAAYIFSRNTEGSDAWGQVKKLTASDAQASDYFGISVSISGDTALIGASGEDSGGSSAGAFYCFTKQIIYEYQTRADGNWNCVDSGSEVWERRESGSSDAWVIVTDSANLPDYEDAGITVKNAVAVTAALAIDQTTITAAGNLTVNSSQTLTINDGTDTDLTVAGTLTNSGSVTNSGETLVNDTYSHAGTITVNALTYGASGTLVYSGSSPQTTNALEFADSSGPANLTIDNSTGVNLNFTRTLTDNLTLTAGTFTTGSNDLTVTGNVTGSGTLSISTGTVDVNGTYNVSGSTTFTGAGNLKLGGETITSLGTLTDTAGTVWYDRAGAQTVLADNYYNLRISGGTSGNVYTKTLAGDIDVNGDLTIDQYNTHDTGSNYGINIDGDWINSGTFTANSGTVAFDGTLSGKDITANGSSGVFYNVSFTGSGGEWTLQDNMNVSNTFSVSNGKFISGEHTLTILGANAEYINNGSNNTTWTGGTLNIQSDVTTTTFATNEEFSALQLGRFSGTGETIYDILNSGATVSGLTVDSDAKILLTVIEVNAEDKIYDGNSSATINSVMTNAFTNYSNITCTGLFVNKNVGQNKGTTSLTISGGSDEPKYTLTSDTASSTADITAADLTVTPTDVSKTYGTALTGGTGYTQFTAAGLQNGETIGSTTVAYGTGSSTTANVGTYADSVTVSAATGGTFTASNYSITYVQGDIAVTAKALSITAATATNKAYDGTTSATVTAGTLSGFVGSETVTAAGTGTFSDKNVGTSKTVTVAYSLSDGSNGGLASNYSLANTTATADITTADLTVTPDNQTKTSGNIFTFNGTEFTSVGLVSGDAITLVSLASSGASVSAVAGTYTITADSAQGTGLGNYLITYVDGVFSVTGGDTGFNDGTDTQTKTGWRTSGDKFMLGENGQTESIDGLDLATNNDPTANNNISFSETGNNGEYGVDSDVSNNVAGKDGEYGANLGGDYYGKDGEYGIASKGRKNKGYTEKPENIEQEINDSKDEHKGKEKSTAYYAKPYIIPDDFDYSVINSNAEAHSSYHSLFKTELDIIIEEFMIG